MARPTKLNKKLTDKICERMGSGESLLRICKDENMPHRATIHRWLLATDENGNKINKEFCDKYEEAVNLRADKMFDELEYIADDGTNDYIEKERADGSTYVALDSEHVQRSRLRIDTRKWYLSKIMPKKYGDRSTLVTEDENGNVQPITGMVIKKENGD
jgi:hypothetical protein